MVDFSCEANSGGFERVIGWQLEFETEISALMVVLHCDRSTTTKKKIKLTANGDPAGPSIVTFHSNRLDSSASPTLTPAGGAFVSSASSFLDVSTSNAGVQMSCLGNSLLGSHIARNREYAGRSGAVKPADSRYVTMSEWGSKQLENILTQI